MSDTKHNVKHRRIFPAIFSLLLLVIIVMGTFVARHMAADEVCTDFSIVVIDPADTKFVTAAELERELGGFVQTVKGRRLSLINTDSLRRELEKFDKIEDVEVLTYTDGSIVVTVTALQPVARIFDGQTSYYINRDGKIMAANARYHVDVPVISGSFSDDFPATSLLPLLDYIAASPKWEAMTSMISVGSPTDVYLMPQVRGIVINLGSPDEASLPDKFRRLDRFFDKVIHAKGWEYYDTISVKWSGQAVASRRDKSLSPITYVVEDVTANEIIDRDIMTISDSIVDGQALPGAKGHPETIIPASRKQQPKAPAAPATPPAAAATQH